MAVISLLLAATATLPRLRWLAAAQTLTRWTRAWPSPGRYDPRSAWPNPEDYDRQAAKLRKMFDDNYGHVEEGSDAG